MSGSKRYIRWYVAITGLITVMHPLLPADARKVSYLCVSVIATIPLTTQLHGRTANRRPWAVLCAAFIIISLGNGLISLGGVSWQLVANLFITLGNALMLSAAIIVVRHRGRNDVGGLLDVSVAAIGLGGLLWTSVLYPRLSGLGSSQSNQLSILVSILVLVGVLGALARVRSVADRRLPALDFLLAALILALIGNILLALTAGSPASGRPGWVEMFIMMGYVCVGVAALHPSAPELMLTGPAPADRLSVGRLVFLGAALAVSAVVGGVRQLLGLEVDGAMLAVGSLVISTLVMVRVGRLAHQRQHAEAALLHQATHDPLTGLPNRAELLNRLQAALARERAEGRPGVVLLFCDLNGFKGVNDRLGHLAGDELLTEVAGRLRTILRTGDTVARYGGDEFLVLCEDTDQEQAVFRLLDHIAQCLDEPFELAGEQVRISCSVGAVASDGDSDGDDLILHADQAMYRAKQRDRVDVPR